MKSLRILVFAGLLMLASVMASAQELTETTTIGPITVQHPANFVVEAVSGGVGLIDDTDSFAILIFTSGSLADMGLPDFPIPTGVFSAVQAPVYEDMVLEQERAAIEQRGRGSIDALLKSGDTWTIA